MPTALPLRERKMFIQPGDRAVVTGATGFIGSAIARVLVRRGVHVVAIAPPSSLTLALEGLDCDIIEADLNDVAALTEACVGAKVLFHVPPDYRSKTQDPRSFQDVNVEDTRRILAAARGARVEKVVYTSSVGTLGVEGATFENPADETSIPRIDQVVGPYKQSKYVAEHEVLREAAEGLPITLVLPTTSIGEFDFMPTPSGRIILNFLNGHPANWFDTSLNVVDVEDLAEGYVLAAERGGVGRSYILGGENIAYSGLFSALEKCTGLKNRGFRVPRSAALSAAMLSEFFEGKLLRRTPSVPMEGVRLASTPLIFSDARARTELGYSPRSAAESIARAARWFIDNGLVSPRQARDIVWNGEATPAPTSIGVGD